MKLENASGIIKIAEKTVCWNLSITYQGCGRLKGKEGPLAPQFFEILLSKSILGPLFFRTQGPIVKSE